MQQSLLQAPVAPPGSWSRAIVAATGPSLTPEVCATVRQRQLLDGWRVIAVNDAWRPLYFSDALYACELRWWDHYATELERFQGERWTSCSTSPQVDDDKTAWASSRPWINLVDASSEEGFCLGARKIHYGSNSGFQAINLALVLGATEVRMVGFDMRVVGSRSHFFGEHPEELRKPTRYEHFVADFERGARSLPPSVHVINCTPGSALTCFPMGVL